METGNKRKALGKGLEQLFSNESLYSNPLEELNEIQENASKEDVVEIDISELRSNPYQPRLNFDEEKLKELADSIKEFGVLEPIIVKKSIKGYEIVAGERRTKASEIAGLKKIPAIIKDGAISFKSLKDSIKGSDHQSCDLCPKTTPMFCALAVLFL